MAGLPLATQLAALHSSICFGQLVERLAQDTWAAYAPPDKPAPGATFSAVMA